MKKLFFIFLIINLFLTSCIFSNCDKVRFSKEDAKWLVPYEENDTLVFYSKDVKRRDIFIISKTRYFSKCNKIEKGKIQHEIGTIRGLHISSNADDTYYNCGFHLELNKELQSDSTEASNKVFNLFNMTSGYITNLETEARRKKIFVPALNKKINGFYFDSSLLRDIKPCSKLISSFIWSKDFGLLSYTTKDSVEYVRIK